MDTDRVSVMGLFDSEVKTAAAIRELRTSSFTIERVHAPIPSHLVADALALPKSKVGWFTLIGGIVGFFSGFALAAFTATRWNLIVSGKPVIALVPFFIVGFEFTILFAVFGNVLGIISQARLPRFKANKRYHEHLTRDRFGVLASCPAEQQSGLQQFFETKGAEIQSFPASSSSG
jgi:molybdopterin-containing oxidoreductase family membrane subunit